MSYVPFATLDLNQAKSVYHFGYVKGGGDDKTLEELLCDIALRLRGQAIITEQNAAIVVLGYDKKNRVYVLSYPQAFSESSVQDFFKEKKLNFCHVKNKKLARIEIYNIYISGGDARILDASVDDFLFDSNGYVRLYPLEMSLNTQELDAVMTVLIRLKMLNMSHHNSIGYLRRKYRKG